MSRAAKIDRRREKRVVALMALFPFFVAAGLFAPGFVRLLALAQPLEETPRAEMADRVGPFAKRPLLVPRDFDGESSGDLIDLDMLFREVHYEIDHPRALARIAPFPMTGGDTIPIDDTGEPAQEIHFRDMLAAEKQREIDFDTDHPLAMLPMCGTLHHGNCVRDDDFTVFSKKPTDPVPVIPEPGTGALLALGVTLLGLRPRS